MYDDLLENSHELTDKEFRNIYCDICTDKDECPGMGKLLKICKKINTIQKRIKGRN